MSTRKSETNWVTQHTISLKQADEERLQKLQEAGHTIMGIFRAGMDSVAKKSGKGNKFGCVVKQFVNLAAEAEKFKKQEEKKS